MKPTQFKTKNKQMRFSGVCLLLLLAVFGACSVARNNQAAVQQGVSGQVVWTEGNQMPSIGTTRTSGSKPVVRSVRIYELTNNSQVKGAAPLFDSVNSKLVSTVKTDRAGHFQCQLPAGRYSIFTVEEGDKLFASLGDGDGHIAPFEVKANEVTKYDININYRAAY